MNKYCKAWIQEWCQENGWTDLFLERRDYWAFPPHAVMPMPIPTEALQLIKAEKGMSPEERLWCASAWFAAVTGALLTYWLQSPMPLVAAFAFSAIAVAKFEDDD
ncbi:hypothetical protein H6G89_25180 [Oscillatoria sp. FACHB-1407]|uniref:slr1957 family protein n=1 Tax=Oscillatoria sp. FACHB-1407 TaxID=2692847 RepID=UPI0016851859|nr:hypothetical protein [Oscillatoria sp. FACHB-1407]MBD2464301.1 hypothetical protein [Oscillatoria sp. FACHB-1407]